MNEWSGSNTYFWNTFLLSCNDYLVPYDRPDAERTHLSCILRPAFLQGLLEILDFIIFRALQNFLDIYVSTSVNYEARGWS
jgi:hypothetical protein